MQQLLISVLSDLNNTSVDIIASAVISTDGLPIATLLSNHRNRSVHELACGELDQVMVKGKNGYILLSQAGDNAVLALIAKESGKLGLILLDAKRAAKHIAEIL